MIAAHRRAHRRIHALLWPLVVALVTAAVATRRPVDAPTDWPSFLAENARVGRPLWSRDDAFGAWPAQLALFADDSLELRPRRPLDRPELLLYWVPGAFAGDMLPDGARLLGRVTGTQAQRFALPAGTRRAEGGPGDAGSLVVYSLGHGEIVAAAKLP